MLFVIVPDKENSRITNNLTNEVSIESLLPLIIDLNTIKHEKVSLFSKAATLGVINKDISELVIFTEINMS